MTSRNPPRDKAYPAVRLKHTCTDPGQYGLNVAAADYADEGVRLIRTSDIQARGLATDGEGIFITGPVEERFQLRYNDLVVSRAGTIGRAFLAPREAEGMAFAGFLVRFRPRPSVVPRFLFYVTQGTEFQQAIQRDAVSNTISNFNAARYASLSVPLPPQAEQEVIADFLDRETAQIDAMIEAQRELVARLQERKSAMITRALANPQDAGVVKLAWVFTFHNGDRGASYPSREELVQDGVPFINAGHLTGRSIDFSTMSYITDEKFSRMGGAKLQRGDILFCVRGSLGKTGLFDVDGSGALASSLVALRRSQPSVDVSFYLYLLGGIRTADQIRLAQTGSAQPNLAVDQLAQFRYEVPALEEQQAIAGYLDRETGRIDSVIEATNESINLMEERRSALISAAVTGRIDPRTGDESALDKVGVSA